MDERRAPAVRHCLEPVARSMRNDFEDRLGLSHCIPLHPPALYFPDFGTRKYPVLSRCIPPCRGQRWGQLRSPHRRSTPGTGPTTDVRSLLTLSDSTSMVRLFPRRARRGFLSREKGHRGGARRVWLIVTPPSGGSACIAALTSSASPGVHTAMTAQAKSGKESTRRSIAPSRAGLGVCRRLGGAVHQQSGGTRPADDESAAEDFRQFP